MPCFIQAFYRIEPGRLAMAQPFDLGKYEPHPVGSFSAAFELGKDAAVDLVLRFDEAVQIVRSIGQCCSPS